MGTRQRRPEESRVPWETAAQGSPYYGYGLSPAATSMTGVSPCLQGCVCGVQRFPAVRTEALDAACVFGQTVRSEAGSFRKATVGDLVVLGDATFEGAIRSASVTGTLVASDLTVSGDLSVEGALSVTGFTSAAGGLLVGSPLEASRSATASPAPALVVVGDTDLSAGTLVTSNVQTSGVLVVSGTAVFQGDLVFSSTATSYTGVSSLSVSGALAVGGPSTLNGGLTTSSLTASQTVSVAGAARLAGGLTTSSLTASGQLAVEGLAVLQGGVVAPSISTTTLSVSGPLSALGGLRLENGGFVTLPPALSQVAAANQLGGVARSAPAPNVAVASGQGVTTPALNLAAGSYLLSVSFVLSAPVGASTFTNSFSNVFVGWAPAGGGEFSDYSALRPADFVGNDPTTYSVLSGAWLYSSASAQSVCGRLLPFFATTAGTNAMQAVFSGAGATSCLKAMRIA